MRKHKSIPSHCMFGKTPFENIEFKQYFKIETYKVL